MSGPKTAAAYLLDQLDAGERAKFERRLESDPALRAEVEALGKLSASLEALPADGWPAASTAAPPEATSPPRWRRSLSLSPAIAVGALAIALALGGLLGAMLGSGGSESATPVIVMRALSGSSSESATVAMPGPGEMVLNVSGLPASGAGQYYELWLMSTPRRTVPVASFRVGDDGAATVRVPLPADPGRYRYFDLSRQIVTGGTGHSDESVLRGPTSPS